MGASFHSRRLCVVPAFLCKGVAQALAYTQGEQDEVFWGVLIVWYLIRVDGWGWPSHTSSRLHSSDSICSLGPRTSSAASTAHWCSGRLPNHELSFTSHLSQKTHSSPGAGPNPALLAGSSTEGTCIHYYTFFFFLDHAILGLQSQTFSWLII